MHVQEVCNVGPRAFLSVLVDGPTATAMDIPMATDSDEYDFDPSNKDTGGTGIRVPLRVWAASCRSIDR